MAEDARTCRRTGCNEPAAASLSFRYETRQVWVTAPMRDGKGTRYDLCLRHADSLTVPRGWHRVDERDSTRKKSKGGSTGAAAAAAAKAPQSPPDRQRADRTPPPPAVSPSAEPVTADAVQDRYARLLSELPQLAEQVPLLRGQDMGADVMGQLAIPVPDRGQPDAVIVSLTELAGARRDRESLRH